MTNDSDLPFETLQMIAKNVSSASALQEALDAPRLSPEIKALMEKMNKDRADMINTLEKAKELHLNNEYSYVPPRFPISPNPIIKTNEKLDILSTQNDNFIELQERSATLLTSLNDVMVAMSIETSRNAAATNRQNSKMIFISTIAVVVAVLTSAWTYYQSSHDAKLADIKSAIDKQTKAIESLK